MTYLHTRIRIRIQIWRGFRVVTIVLCQIFELDTNRYSCRSQMATVAIFGTDIHLRNRFPVRIRVCE